jgi:transposase
MTRPYSMDLRERAIARVVAGESVRTVAAALSISAATVVRWSQRYRASGSPPFVMATAFTTTARHKRKALL